MNRFFPVDLVPIFTADEYFVLMPAFIVLLTSLVTLLLAAGFRKNHSLASKVCFSVTFIGFVVAPVDHE